jgi:hypothetical protein
MFRTYKNQLIAGVLITGILAFGSMAFQQIPPRQEPQEHREGPKNLKILPKNIDHASLIAIMHDFEHALNYKCNDCHVASATDPKHLDFASDANPKKEVARHMMKMMEKINKKFFKVKGDFAANYVNAKYEVTCYTCHHGNEHPMKFSEMRDTKPGMGHRHGEEGERQH